jgi:hypothetical protein
MLQRENLGIENGPSSPHHVAIPTPGTIYIKEVDSREAQNYDGKST